MEILKKTRFLRRVHERCDEKSPETILQHDRVIWLGDLKYWIALSYRSPKALVEMHNWRALLERDQEDVGTGYLVKPGGIAEEEGDGSDFDSGDDDDDDENIDEEDDEGDAAGKRRRASKDDSDDDSGEDDERPPKR